MINLSPKNISQLAIKTGFIKDNVEKAMRLLDVLDHIYTTPFWQEKLVLKGGTAINLCYANMPRLSVDIDLDYIGTTKAEMLEDREALEQFLEKSLSLKNYSLLAGKSKNYYALTSQVYQYVNNMGNRDNIKIEINYLNRCHILPYNELKVDTKIGSSETKLLVLNQYELFGSKIAALIDRCKSRDIYDVYGMISKKSLPDMDLLRKCTIFYNCIGGQANLFEFDPINMFKEISKNDFRRYLWPILNKKERFDENTAMIQIKDYMDDFLTSFTDEEKEFVDSFRKNKYYPNLLFSDLDTLCRIKKHPAALWRIGNAESISSGKKGR